MQWLRIILATLFSITLSACVINNDKSAAEITDEELANKLVGVWANKFSEGSHIYGYELLYADGKGHSFGFDETQYNQANTFYLNITYRWQIKDGQKCNAIITSNMSKILPPGKIWCSNIVSLTDKHWVFEDDNGQPVTLYKMGDHTVPEALIKYKNSVEKRRK